jgi:pyridoxamine 5'-phosphate oxidase
MIKFINNSQGSPFKLFREKYNEALLKEQAMVEALCISSYCSEQNEINSRYVNLKMVNKDKFIFFTNYNSPKSKQFKSHKQISALIYWNKVNTQIRIKATIRKTTSSFNQNYFSQRSIEKNALAISSSQSEIINSYEDVKTKYHTAIKNENLLVCPKYWGGFEFEPYEFEFWEGNEFRLNKRLLFKYQFNNWVSHILEP